MQSMNLTDRRFSADSKAQVGRESSLIQLPNEYMTYAGVVRKIYRCRRKSFFGNEKWVYSSVKWQM